MSLGVRVKARVYICGLNRFTCSSAEGHLDTSHVRLGYHVQKPLESQTLLPKNDALVHDLHLTAYHGWNISLITHTYQLIVHYKIRIYHYMNIAYFINI